jgi:hypothetical protein
MDIYTVTQAFDLPLLPGTVQIGDSVSKYSNSVNTLVNTTRFPNSAFYSWIGSTDSLGYLSFAGSVVDPPDGLITQAHGVVALTAGQNYYTLVSAFGFLPTTMIGVVMTPTAGQNILLSLRSGTLSATGFTVDFTATIPGAGYSLNYLVVQ